MTLPASQDTVDKGGVANGTLLEIPPAAGVASFETVELTGVPAERPSELEAPLEAIDSGVAPLGTEHEARRRRRRRIVSLVVGLAALTWFGVARTDHSVRGQGKIAAKKWAPISTEAAGIVRNQIKREGEFVHAGESIAALDTSLESDAVAIAELDVAQVTHGMEVDDLQLARNAIDLERAQIVAKATAAYALCIPPPEVIELASFIESTVRARKSAQEVTSGTKARIGAIRRLLGARKDQIDKQEPGKGTKLLDAAVDAAAERVLTAARNAADGRSLEPVDSAIEHYEATIFEGLRDLSGAHAVFGSGASPLSRWTRRATAAAAQKVAGNEGALEEVSAEERHEEGYFELRQQYRIALLELRRSGNEAMTLAQLRSDFPSIAGERNGELEALRRALAAFLVRSRAPVGTRTQDDEAGWDGDAARAEIARLADVYLTGVSASANRIDELNSPGLATFKRNALQLRSGFSNTDRALRKALEVRGLLKGALVAARELDDQVALAERDSSAFLDSINEVILSARELIERRLGDVELEKERARNSVEIARGRLRDAMTVSKAGEARNAIAPASATRLRLLENERLQLQAAHSEHESALARAKMALKVARRAVEARNVKAPMDGVIVSLTAHEHSVLARDESVGIVQALDGLVFKAIVSDDDLGCIKVGQPARIHLDEGKTGALEGRVVWIASRVGEVVEKEYWNVLVAVDGGEPSLLPMPNGRVDIVVERPRGVERLRKLLEPAPPVHRPYPSPQVVDPTLLAREPANGKDS